MKIKKIHVFVFLVGTFFLSASAGFACYIAKIAPYTDAINRYAAQNNISPALIKAMIKVESKFRPDAVSHRGARGLMQIMPRTGREIAANLNIENYNDDMLFDPEINIRFGAYYIRRLLDLFGGNLSLALAAYNAGMGNVGRWKRETPMIAVDLSKIPFQETKAYVKNVRRAYKFYEGAEKLRRLLTLTSKP
ncbi:MAG: lytic transglycosylase domain-containing protein [Elusimicrobia bacterium]|nr:lytic transglycosylase domain-containing protein [Elusimicrobiota bacterium]